MPFVLLSSCLFCLLASAWYPRLPQSACLCDFFLLQSILWSSVWLSNKNRVFPHHSDHQVVSLQAHPSASFSVVAPNHGENQFISQPKPTRFHLCRAAQRRRFSHPLLTSHPHIIIAILISTPLQNRLIPVSTDPRLDISLRSTS